MSTKIQINSVQALTNLLEGEGEFAVEFRKSVLLEYERKHILPTVEKKVEELVDAAAIGTLCDKSRSYPYRMTLKPKFVEMIKEAVQEEMDGRLKDLIRKTIQELVNEACSREQLQGIVEARVTTESTRQLKEAIAKQVQEAMK